MSGAESAFLGALQAPPRIAYLVIEVLPARDTKASSPSPNRLSE
jgi:hypothetical protein